MRLGGILPMIDHYDRWVGRRLKEYRLLNNLTLEEVGLKNVIYVFLSILDVLKT